MIYCLNKNRALHSLGSTVAIGGRPRSLLRSKCPLW